MFFGPNRIFFGPRVTKNVGDLPVCFLDPVGIFFLDLYIFVLDPGNFFSTAKLIVSELGFCFLDPCACFVDLASIGWGGNSIVIGAHIGLGVFWTLAPSFLEPVHVFLDLAQGGGNLDIETRCMREVVDAGEVRILKQQKRKKWWRGQWGKATYEAKWMQEIERHIGGRESSILKHDEHKKLLRDEG